MMKGPSQGSGFALAEAILSVTVITLFIFMFVGISVHVHRQSRESLLAEQALLYAQEGLEAARAIRNEEFSLLESGIHGLSAEPEGWKFTDDEEALGIFRRTVEVAPEGAGIMSVTATVVWEDQGRSFSSSVSTLLSSWR